MQSSTATINQQHRCQMGDQSTLRQAGSRAKSCSISTGTPTKAGRFPDQKMLELGMYVLLYLVACTILTTLAGMLGALQRLPSASASACVCVCVCCVCVALSFLKKSYPLTWPLLDNDHITMCRRSALRLIRTGMNLRRLEQRSGKSQTQIPNGLMIHPSSLSRLSDLTITIICIGQQR